MIKKILNIIVLLCVTVNLFSLMPVVTADSNTDQFYNLTLSSDATSDIKNGDKVAAVISIKTTQGIRNIDYTFCYNPEAFEIDTSTQTSFLNSDWLDNWESLGSTSPKGSFPKDSHFSVNPDRGMIFCLYFTEYGFMPDASIAKQNFEMAKFELTVKNAELAKGSYMAVRNISIGNIVCDQRHSNVEITLPGEQPAPVATSHSEVFYDDFSTVHYDGVNSDLSYYANDDGVKFYSTGNLKYKTWTNDDKMAVQRSDGYKQNQYLEGNASNNNSESYIIYKGDFGGKALAFETAMYGTLDMTAKEYCDNYDPIMQASYNGSEWVNLDINYIDYNVTWQYEGWAPVFKKIGTFIVENLPENSEYIKVGFTGNWEKNILSFSVKPEIDTSSFILVNENTSTTAPIATNSPAAIQTPEPTVAPTAEPELPETVVVTFDEPMPEPPGTRMVTLNPPTVDTPSGTVAYGTEVKIFANGAHICYRLNDNEAVYEYFDTSVVITEDTTLTVLSWSDTVESGVRYEIPSAVYTYTVERSSAPSYLSDAVISVSLATEYSDEKFEFNINLYSSDIISGIVLVGLYDGNENLIDLKIYPASEVLKISADKTDNAHHVRFMWLDNIYSIIPMCESQTIEL